MMENAGSDNAGEPIVEISDVPIRGLNAPSKHDGGVGLDGAEEPGFDPTSPGYLDDKLARTRRARMKGIAPIAGLDETEVSALALAGLMMPDPFEMLLISDPLRRAEIVDGIARRRLQTTSLLVPPKGIDDFVEGRRTVGITSELYLRGEKSLAELMVVLRSSTKVLEAFRRGYEEQYALHQEALRLVLERQQMQRTMRHSPPKYLIDFARLLEELGCNRNHLRSVNGAFVKMIRAHLDLSGSASGASDDEEAERLRLWLVEGDAIDASAAVSAENDVEFDRLSRIAAGLLMSGDLEAARAAFANLEKHGASLEESFGAGFDGVVDADDELVEDRRSTGLAVIDNRDGAVVGTASNGVLGEHTAAVADGHEGSASSDRSSPVVASKNETAEAESGVEALPVLPAESENLGLRGGPTSPVSFPAREVDPALLAPDISPDLSQNGWPSSSAKGPVVAIPPEPIEPIADPSLKLINPCLKRAADQPSGEPFPPSTASAPSLSVPSDPPLKYLTGWADEAPSGIDHGRAEGVGRLPGNDAFGGIVSKATSAPEVIPMWLRENRKGQDPSRLTLDDWHRFEVPFGSYALLHRPKLSPFYTPVDDKMFPPKGTLKELGEMERFSPNDLKALELADQGKGPMDVAIQAVRAVLTTADRMQPDSQEVDEDLVRFWLFLLVGRRFMEQIDLLFPHGYFHGVIAPDPMAQETQTGHFQLVRILDDGDLDEELRMPRFEPFNGRLVR